MPKHALLARACGDEQMREPHNLPVERYGRVAPLQPIVIVEDDPVTLAGWSELLAIAGYPIVGANTFAAGRHAVDAGCGLLIVDVRLGAFNGLQLMLRAQSRTPPVPAIVVTGFADEVIACEARRLGALCLEKPVDPDHLLAAVASRIDGLNGGGPRHT